MSLNADTGVEQVLPLSVPHGGIRYPGEAVVTQRWRPALARPLEGDVYFRVVLLRGHRRLLSLTLQDPRIAVFVPARGVGQKRASAQQELHALREAQAEYLTHRDPGIAGLRRSLEERAQEIQGTLLRDEAQAYASGSVYAHADADIAPSRIFLQGEPEEWITRAASNLLAGAYPQIPLDPSGFPYPLHPNDIRSLYDAVFAPRPSIEERRLLEGFAPGLGLTRAEEPHSFDPRQCQVFSMIASELERGNGIVSGEALLTLLGHTYGLTYPLATLYLLAFLGARTPRTELVLREDHALRLRSGERLPGRRLSGRLAADLEWPASLQEQVETLRYAQAPSWNQALPYAWAFDPQLEEARSPEEEARQEQRLMDTLGALREQMPQVRHSLESLAEGLRTAVESGVVGSLERLTPVAQARDVAQFLERVQGQYATIQEVRDDTAQLQGLRRLAEAAPEMLQVRRYLNELRTMGDWPELELDRTTLLQQMELTTFVRHPSRWNEFRAVVNGFRSRYAAAYAEHHEQYQHQATGLVNEIDRARAKVAALERLNSIDALGGPTGVGVPERFQQLWSLVKLCSVAREDLPLMAAWRCPTCEVLLGEAVPHQEVRRVLEELDNALGEQNRRLSRRVVHKILERRREPYLERFLKVVQASDLSGLGNVLDDSVTEFIRQVLRSP